MAEKGGKPKSQRSSPDKGKENKKQTKRPEEEGSIPVLRYWQGNNFIKFRDALTKAALKEYGLLRKLIKQEQIE
jgi:hypothetical protein